MRLFEILAQAALLPVLLGFILPRSRRPRWLALLPILAIMFLLAHLLLESWRCQMITTYFLAALLFLATARNAFPGPNVLSAAPPRRRRRLTVIGAVMGLLVLGDAFAQLVFLPVFRLPEPSGPYAVGTTSFQLADTERPDPESVTDVRGASRVLMVQAWYPAEAAPDARPAGYWEDAPLLLNHLSLVQTHSYPDAPPADSQRAFPVLIFSHGYAVGYIAQNTVLMEELASHGYVVFSVAHPYEALAVTYPDGHHVAVSFKQVQALVDESKSRSAYFDELGVDREDIYGDEALLRKMFELAPLVHESLDTWTTDTVFVMDELERISADEDASSLFERLDLTRIGVFGMSFGGATAGQVCLIDSRCRAGINLDGTQFGDLLDGALQQPFMLMYSENNAGMNDFVFERAENAAYSITITGAVHEDFADFTIMSPPLKSIGLLGSIDGQRMLEINNAYVLAFFDRHLRGESTPLLDGPSPAYPEVELEGRSP